MNPGVKKFFSHKEDYDPKNRLAYEIYTNCKFLVWALCLAFIAHFLVFFYNYFDLGKVPYSTNFFEILFYSIPNSLFGWHSGFYHLDQSGWSDLFHTRLSGFSDDLSNAFNKTFMISLGLLVIGRYFLLIRKWVLKNK